MRFRWAVAMILVALISACDGGSGTSVSPDDAADRRARDDFFAAEVIDGPRPLSGPMSAPMWPAEPTTTEPVVSLEILIPLLHDIPQPAGSTMRMTASNESGIAFEVTLPEVMSKCDVAGPIEAWFTDLGWDYFALGTHSSVGWGSLRFVEFFHPTDPVSISWSMETHDRRYWLNIGRAPTSMSGLPRIACVDDPAEPPVPLASLDEDQAANRGVVSALERELSGVWDTVIELGSTQVLGREGSTVAWQTDFELMASSVFADPCPALRALRATLEDHGYDITVQTDSWHRVFHLRVVGPDAVMWGELDRGHRRWVLRVMPAVGTDGSPTHDPSDRPLVSRNPC